MRHFWLRLLALYAVVRMPARALVDVNDALDGIAECWDDPEMMAEDEILDLLLVECVGPATATIEDDEEDEDCDEDDEEDYDEEDEEDEGHDIPELERWKN